MHRDPDTDDIFDVLVRLIYVIDLPPSDLTDNSSTLVALDYDSTNYLDDGRG